MIFKDLGDKVGFQKDNVYNQFDLMRALLDSRSRRMPSTKALLLIFYSYMVWVSGPIYAPELDDAAAPSSGDLGGRYDPSTGQIRSGAVDGNDNGTNNLRWTLTDLSGVVACLFAIIATLSELTFLPIATCNICILIC